MDAPRLQVSLPVRKELEYVEIRLPDGRVVRRTRQELDAQPKPTEVKG